MGGLDKRRQKRKVNLIVLFSHCLIIQSSHLNLNTIGCRSSRTTLNRINGQSSISITPYAFLDDCGNDYVHCGCVLHYIYGVCMGDHSSTLPVKLTQCIYYSIRMTGYEPSMRLASCIRCEGAERAEVCVCVYIIVCLMPHTIAMAIIITTNLIL